MNSELPTEFLDSAPTTWAVCGLLSDSAHQDMYNIGLALNAYSESEAIQGVFLKIKGFSARDVIAVNLYEFYADYHAARKKFIKFLGDAGIPAQEYDAYLESLHTVMQYLICTLRNRLKEESQE